MKCSVEDCNRKSRAKGMCDTHYRRLQSFGDPGSFLIKNARINDPESDQRWCPDCQAYSHVSLFNKNKSNFGGYHCYCKRHHEARKLPLKYGITLEDKERMFEEQLRKCPSCMNPFVSFEKANIDHCHKTLIVRCLLCYECNHIEGKLLKVQHVLYNAFMDNIEHNLKLLKEKNKKWLT